MKINLVINIIVSLLFIASCNNIEETEIVEVPFVKEAVQKENVIFVDSVSINGNNFFIYESESCDSIILVKNKKDTSYTELECGEIEFLDFNRDGVLDLYITYYSNVPGINEVMLYNVENENFEKVKNMLDFPVAIKIEGSKYYYSYHRSGCADLNWDSDLFYIENYKAIKVGNIYGNGCDGVGEQQFISISKVNKDSLINIETLSIDTIEFYKDYKWGFIRHYWKNNLNKFN